MTPWDLLRESAKTYHIALSDEQINCFKRYYGLLLEGNRTCNLTRITGEREVVVKHFLDSLLALEGVPFAWRGRECRLLDIGSGAGFPGLPVLLACPTWQGVLLEATRKKAEFLANTIAALGLSDRAEAYWGRADNAPVAELQRYDVVTARAVTALERIAGWTLPFAKPGGRVVLLKGPQCQGEVEAARAEFSRSGGTEPQLLEFELPEQAGKRTLVIIEKQHAKM